MFPVYLSYLQCALQLTANKPCREYGAAVEKTYASIHTEIIMKKKWKGMLNMQADATM